MNLPQLLSLPALTAALALLFVTPAFSETSSKEVAVFNMFETPLVAPDKYFLTANSGPYLEELRWEKWGKKRTTATGIFVNDCASCGPEERRPAIFKFWRIRDCDRQGMRVYTRGKFLIVNDDGSRKKVKRNPAYRTFCR